MNVLIIGGAGFLGSNLVLRYAEDKNAVITVLDNLDPHFHSSVNALEKVWDKITFVKGDMRDETVLAQVVQGQDIIINCAAQTSHPMSLQYPLMDADINCMGNLKLLEVVRALNRKATVVYTSSSTVIGKAVNEVVDETHGEKPLEIYSANKSVAEKYYEIYHTMYDLKTVIVRFANLYGPYGKGFPEFGFVNYFIHQAWQNDQIKIFGPGTQRRNVMHVDDAVEVIRMVSSHEHVYGKPYFATSDANLSVLEIAGAIVDVFGRGEVIHIPWPEERSRMEIGNVRFSSQRLRELTGWQPRYDFREGLARTKAVFKKNS